MKVKIQHPGLPDEYQLSLTGLNAILLNNTEVEVDDEAIAQYENVTGKKFADVLQGAAFTGIRPDPPQEPQQEEVVDNNDDEGQQFNDPDGEE